MCEANMTVHESLDSGLKTLKDLEFPCCTKDDGCNSKHEYKELKAEAIKWVKELEKGECDCLDYERGQCDFCANEQKISWIIDFFNITDSDLKEAKT